MNYISCPALWNLMVSQVWQFMNYGFQYWKTTHSGQLMRVMHRGTSFICESYEVITTTFKL